MYFRYCNVKSWNYRNGNIFGYAKCVDLKYNIISNSYTILSVQMSYIVTIQYLNRFLQWGVTIFISNRKAFKQRLCRYTAIKLKLHL